MFKPQIDQSSDSPAFSTEEDISTWHDMRGKLCLSDVNGMTVSLFPATSQSTMDSFTSFRY